MSTPLLGNIIQVLLAAGGGATILGVSQAVVQRFFGKHEQQVNAAKVIQAMSLDMIEPLHQELAEARATSAELRTDLEELRDQLDQMLTWARLANVELRKNGLSVGPIPIRIVARR